MRKLNTNNSFVLIIFKVILYLKLYYIRSKQQLSKVSPKKRNGAVWEKCGAALLTCACLQNNLPVRREIGDGGLATEVAKEA